MLKKVVSLLVVTTMMSSVSTGATVSAAADFSSSANYGFTINEELNKAPRWYTKKKERHNTNGNTAYYAYVYVGYSAHKGSVKVDGKKKYHDDVMVKVEFEPKPFTGKNLLGVKTKYQGYPEYYSVKHTVSGVIKTGYEDYEYSQQKMLWGREPKNKDEVVISSSVAEELGYAQWNENAESMESLLHGSKTCSVADLYAAQYGYEYKEEINLHDYLGEKVNIVGILESSDENIPADVYIEKTVYKNIRHDYLKYYYGDRYIVYYDDINDFVEQCEDGEITIENPIVLNIIIFDSLLSGAEMLLYVVIILLMIVLFLVIISYVSYSISDSSRNIGIMRTLGITNGDILKIYSQEALMLSVFAIICTFLETNVMLRFLNEEYSEKILGYKTLFIEWNTNVMLIMIVIICVICICASAIPIRKLSREYPIKLMKKIQ